MLPILVSSGKYWSIDFLAQWGSMQDYLPTWEKTGSPMSISMAGLTNGVEQTGSSWSHLHFWCLALIDVPFWQVIFVLLSFEFLISRNAHCGLVMRMYLCNCNGSLRTHCTDYKRLTMLVGLTLSLVYKSCKSAYVYDSASLSSPDPWPESRLIGVIRSACIPLFSSLGQGYYWSCAKNSPSKRFHNRLRDQIS